MTEWQCYIRARQDYDRWARGYEEAQRKAWAKVDAEAARVESRRFDVSGIVEVMARERTHRQLAALLGVSPSTVSRWRNGAPALWSSVQLLMANTGPHLWPYIAPVV